MIETCAIRVREKAPTVSLGAAFAELLSEKGEPSRRVEGYVIRQEHGPEWVEFTQYPGRATLLCSRLARTLDVPLLAIVASLDEVAYLRHDDDDADPHNDHPVPEGMAQVVHLHVEMNGQFDDRSAQYDPDARTVYASGDPWETLTSMLLLHLPESSLRNGRPESGTTRVVRISGYLPRAEVPERLDLLCSMISAAGAFGTRTVGGATMVSVEAAGARRFERIQDGDLALIKEATGVDPT